MCSWRALGMKADCTVHETTCQAACAHLIMLGGVATAPSSAVLHNLHAPAKGSAHAVRLSYAMLKLTNASRARLAQGERYSMGYFVWPRYSDVMQGPLKKFPEITFRRFMQDKSKGFG